MIGRMFFSRRAVAVCIASIAGVIGFAQPPGVSAGIILCRDDPVIMLSNGGSIHLDAVVGDSASDIQSLNYVVHVPQGASVRHIVTTGGPLSTKTSITVLSDAASGMYSVGATVITGQSSSVQVTIMVPSAGSSTTSGMSGSAVTAQVG